MTDRYEKIRQALAMRPTPGPWEVINGTDVFTPLGARNAAGVEAAADDGWYIADCDMGPSFTEDGKEELRAREKEANAALIASCDPRTLSALLDECDALAAEVERLRREAHPAITHCDNCGCDWLDNGLNPIGCPYCELRREVERRWEGNRRAAQEYVEDMRNVLKDAAQVCRDLDDEALAKEGRLACGAECAAAIADLAARRNVPFEIADAMLKAREDGWQPIETAPKPDIGTNGFGERLLLVVDCGDWTTSSVRKGYWEGTDWYLECCGGLATEYGYRVTHWRPLPAPPTTTRRAGSISKETSND